MTGLSEYGGPRWADAGPLLLDLKPSRLKVSNGDAETEKTHQSAAALKLQCGLARAQHMWCLALLHSEAVR